MCGLELERRESVGMVLMKYEIIRSSETISGPGKPYGKVSSIVLCDNIHLFISIQ